MATGVSGAAQTEQTATDSLSVQREVATGRFYFHVRAGDRLTLDEEGVDLPDFLAAQREAMLRARELLAEAIRSAKPEVPEAFVIADEAGQELDTVPLAIVLPRPLKK